MKWWLPSGFAYPLYLLNLLFSQYVFQFIWSIKPAGPINCWFSLNKSSFFDVIRIINYSWMNEPTQYFYQFYFVFFFLYCFKTVDSHTWLISIQIWVRIWMYDKFGLPFNNGYLTWHQLSYHSSQSSRKLYFRHYYQWLFLQVALSHLPPLRVLEVRITASGVKIFISPSRKFISAIPKATIRH